MKPEVVFGLESAAWPALLLNAGGAVLRSNAAGTNTFGVALAGEAPPLSAIWSPENGQKAGGIFCPLGEIADRDGGFEISRCERRNDEIHSGDLHLQFGGPQVVRFAIIARGGAGVGNRSGRFSHYARPGRNQNCAGPGRHDAQTKLECALQLARSVSLDFNNALTSILGHTSLLLSKAEAGHPWRHSLMEVEKSASRAAEIANELSVFSRQEKEAQRAPPGNLNMVVSRCVDFFRSEHGEKIAWKTQLERELFSARFDEAKVQQALTKILENAVEAIGGGTGQIFAQTRNVELAEPTQDRNVHLAAGAYVCIEIGDSGPGIEADILPRIFEPFFTTKGASHRGLGLALVYGIVTNHGGGVAVSSQPGAGTSVRVYLQAEKQFIPESSGADENLHGTETILVVDDEV